MIAIQLTQDSDRIQDIVKEVNTPSESTRRLSHIS
jgi:hypothetical protein